MSSWSKKKKEKSEPLWETIYYLILFDSCLFNKETDKRPRNQRNHHKRILFCYLYTLREFLGMVSTLSFYWRSWVWSQVGKQDSTSYVMQEKKNTLKFLEQLFCLFSFFDLPFLEFVVRVMEKEDRQKVTGGNAVWTSLTLLGLLERELMARYIKQRTKTQVNNARFQVVKNLAVLLF